MKAIFQFDDGDDAYYAADIIAYKNALWIVATKLAQHGKEAPVPERLLPMAWFVNNSSRSDGNIDLGQRLPRALLSRDCPFELFQQYAGILYQDGIAQLQASSPTSH